MASLIPKLIFTDMAAAVHPGTKGISESNNTILVTPMVSKIQYHYVFRIPVFLLSWNTMTTGCGYVGGGFLLLGWHRLDPSTPSSSLYAYTALLSARTNNLLLPTQTGTELGVTLPLIFLKIAHRRRVKSPSWDESLASGSEKNLLLTNSRRSWKS